MPKPAIKMRKMRVGELVIARKSVGADDGDGGRWFAGEIMAALDEGNYR